MKWIGTQLRQTLISTGAVGACFSAVAAIGLLLVTPSSNARLVAQGLQPHNWSETGLKIAVVTLIITLGSIVVFGLLPTAIGKLIGYLVKATRNNA